MQNAWIAHYPLSTTSRGVFSGLYGQRSLEVSSYTATSNVGVWIIEDVLQRLDEDRKRRCRSYHQ